MTPDELTPDERRLVEQHRAEHAVKAMPLMAQISEHELALLKALRAIVAAHVEAFHQQAKTPVAGPR